MAAHCAIPAPRHFDAEAQRRLEARFVAFERGVEEIKRGQVDSISEHVRAQHADQVGFHERSSGFEAMVQLMCHFLCSATSRRWRRP